MLAAPFASEVPQCAMRAAPGVIAFAVNLTARTNGTQSCTLK
jgi:hypothetical protein